MKQTKSRQRVTDHGEVFTAEREVNAMLDLVQQETSRIDSRFLEPACGNGNFLVEILRRKLAAVKVRYGKNAADYERGAVTAVTSLYGVDILPDNVEDCRDRMYEIFDREYTVHCQQTANDETRQAVRHILRHNILCGDTLAVKLCEGEPVHAAGLEEVFRMKFDVIIGNPPYQSSDGGSGNGISARPVYHLFVEKAKQLKPRYLSMIIPARWYAGGKGLDSFREDMLNDLRLEKMVDYPKSRECFQGVDIAGGVTYFLWNTNHTGHCEFTSVIGDSVHRKTRQLNEFRIFVRDNTGVEILRKVRSLEERTMSKVVSARNPFGFVSSDRGESQPFDGCMTLFSSGGKGYVQPADITKNAGIAGRYKLSIGKLNPDRAGVNNAADGKMNVITKMKILSPNEIVTESYLILATFEDPLQTGNCMTYYSTKFVRYLISLTLSSMNISRKNFQFVPVQDFTGAWTDEKLYEKYRLTTDEIGLIERTIRPMPFNSQWADTFCKPASAK